MGLERVGRPGPLDAFEAEHGPERTAEVGELLMNLACMPLDERPGHRDPNAPSPLFRYVDSDGLRIRFLVTEPVVANGLRLVKIEELS